VRHVEFLGPPGSGKSTLAAALISALPETVGLDEAVHRALAVTGSPLTRVVAAVMRSERSKVWRSTYARSRDRREALERFEASHPGVEEAVEQGQLERMARDRSQELVRTWVTGLMARYQLATEHPVADTLVIDEGFHQRAVALFGYGYTEGDRPCLDSYLRSIPASALLVVVDTPDEVCHQRLDARGWSERVKDLPDEERERFLHDSAGVVVLVADHAAQAGVTVFTVNGTVSPSGNAALVADRLKGLST
jgi:dephospho-CoA kinase